MKTYKMYMILPSAIIQMLELKLQSLNFKLTDKVRDVEQLEQQLFLLNDRQTILETTQRLINLDQQLIFEQFDIRTGKLNQIIHNILISLSVNDHKFMTESISLIKNSQEISDNQLSQLLFCNVIAFQLHHEWIVQRQFPQLLDSIEVIKLFGKLSKINLETNNLQTYEDELYEIIDIFELIVLNKKVSESQFIQSAFCFDGLQNRIIAEFFQNNKQYQQTHEKIINKQCSDFHVIFLDTILIINQLHQFEKFMQSNIQLQISNDVLSMFTNTFYQLKIINDRRIENIKQLLIQLLQQKNLEQFSKQINDNKQVVLKTLRILYIQDCPQLQFSFIGKCINIVLIDVQSIIQQLVRLIEYTADLKYIKFEEDIINNKAIQIINKQMQNNIQIQTNDFISLELELFYQDDNFARLLDNIKKLLQLKGLEKIGCIASNIENVKIYLKNQYLDQIGINDQGLSTIIKSKSNIVSFSQHEIYQIYFALVASIVQVELFYMNRVKIQVFNIFFKYIQPHYLLFGQQKCQSYELFERSQFQNMSIQQLTDIQYKLTYKNRVEQQFAIDHLHCSLSIIAQQFAFIHNVECNDLIQIIKNQELNQSSLINNINMQIMLYEWFSLYIRDQMHYSSSRTTISRLFYMHLNMEFPADFNFVQAENYLFEKVEYPSLLKLKENLINNLQFVQSNFHQDIALINLNNITNEQANKIIKRQQTQINAFNYLLQFNIIIMEYYLEQTEQLNQRIFLLITQNSIISIIDFSQQHKILKCQLDGQTKLSDSKQLQEFFIFNSASIQQIDYFLKMVYKQSEIMQLYKLYHIGVHDFHQQLILLQKDQEQQINNLIEQYVSSVLNQNELLQLYFITVSTYLTIQQNSIYQQYDNDQFQRIISVFAKHLKIISNLKENTRLMELTCIKTKQELFHSYRYIFQQEIFKEIFQSSIPVQLIQDKIKQIFDDQSMQLHCQLLQPLKETPITYNQVFQQLTNLITTIDNYLMIETDKMYINDIELISINSKQLIFSLNQYFNTDQHNILNLYKLLIKQPIKHIQEQAIFHKQNKIFIDSIGKSIDIESIYENSNLLHISSKYNLQNVWKSIISKSNTSKADHIKYIIFHFEAMQQYASYLQTRTYINLCGLSLKHSIIILENYYKLNLNEYSTMIEIENQLHTLKKQFLIQLYHKIFIKDQSEQIQYFILQIHHLTLICNSNLNNCNHNQIIEQLFAVLDYLQTTKYSQQNVDQQEAKQVILCSYTHYCISHQQYLDKNGIVFSQIIENSKFINDLLLQFQNLSEIIETFKQFFLNKHIQPQQQVDLVQYLSYQYFDYYYTDYQPEPSQISEQEKQKIIIFINQKLNCWQSTKSLEIDNLFSYSDMLYYVLIFTFGQNYIYKKLNLPTIIINSQCQQLIYSKASCITYLLNILLQFVQQLDNVNRTFVSLSQDELIFCKEQLKILGFTQVIDSILDNQSLEDITQQQSAIKFESMFEDLVMPIIFQVLAQQNIRALNDQFISKFREQLMNHEPFTFNQRFQSTILGYTQCIAATHHVHQFIPYSAAQFQCIISILRLITGDQLQELNEITNAIEIQSTLLMHLSALKLINLVRKLMVKNQNTQAVFKYFQNTPTNLYEFYCAKVYNNKSFYGPSGKFVLDGLGKLNAGLVIFDLNQCCQLLLFFCFELQEYVIARKRQYVQLPTLKNSSKQQLFINQDYKQ